MELTHRTKDQREAFLPPTLRVPALVAVLACLLIVVLFVLVPIVHGAKSLQVTSTDVWKEIVSPLLVGFLGSTVFYLFFVVQTERAFKEDTHEKLQTVVLKTAHDLQTEFVPTGHFSLSNEGDRPFFDSIAKDLFETSTFFFSGLSARTAVMRLGELSTPSLTTALLRIPLSASSARRAANARISLANMRHDSNEIEGRSYDLPYLSAAAEGETYEDSERYIRLLAIETICLAAYVASVSNIKIIVRDWDETAEHRIEFLDPAVYLANYHPYGVPTQFSPGTCRFSNETFIYKLIRKSVSSQIASAESRCGDVLIFEQSVDMPSVLSSISDIWPDMTKSVSSFQSLALGGSSLTTKSSKEKYIENKKIYLRGIQFGSDNSRKDTKERTI